MINPGRPRPGGRVHVVGTRIPADANPPSTSLNPPKPDQNPGAGGRQIPDDLLRRSLDAYLTRRHADICGCQSPFNQCAPGASHPDLFKAEQRAIETAYPLIEEHVREQVGREVLDDPTAAYYDAARAQVDQEIGHDDACEWHGNNGAYCSCRAWVAACAGVSTTADRITGGGP